MVVYESACTPSEVDCGEASGTCQCGLTDDYGGSTRAHCLPREFYAPAEYRDISLWDFTTLPAWVEALITTENSLRAVRTR